jgi:hypothetical protein
MKKEVCTYGKEKTQGWRSQEGIASIKTQLTEKKQKALKRHTKK